MKFKLCFFALLAIMAASCERNIDIPEPGEHEGEIVTIRASIPPETRVTYTDSNTQGSGGTLAWKTGDKLLLAGYDATGAYVNKSTFTWKGNGDEFEGTPVTGATTYKAYYPADAITLDDIGNVQPLAENFWEQTQNLNTTTHLSDKLIMRDTVANALNQTFNLTLQSSIIKFALSWIPMAIGDITKLIWKVETTTGTRSAILDYIDSGFHMGLYRTVTLYLAFDPAAIDIASNGEVKITVIGTGAAYEWSTTVADGKTYDVGKRYTATVNGGWVTIQKPQFRFTIQTTEDNQLYEIWQKDASSTSPATLTINWGEVGKLNTTIPKDASLAKTIASHTYANMGTYTITISSDQLDYSHKQMPQIVFFNQDNYARDEQLTAILDPFPNMGATSFFVCFAACEKLNSIPAELFRYNTQATNFNSCFLNCTQLNSVPEELFKYNTSATDLSNCFQSCTGLNGSIPENLFRYNTQAMDFFACFQGCTGLNGSIPENLFRYNTQAMDFTSCFEDCTGLNGSIPENLFRYNTQAMEFTACFQGCTGLTGTIPAELFRYNTQAQKFDQCFSGCTQLNGTIPAELFKYNTEATNFGICFYGWHQLTEIPADLFKYNTQATSFHFCFYGCTGLTAIPADLFRYNTQATLFNYCFHGCTGLSALPLDLFRYNTQATSFHYCFQGCTGLSTLPLDLFRYNTQAINFYFCFSGCTGLRSLPENLFSYNTQALNFLRCFDGCTKLQLREDIFPDPSTNPDFFEGRKMNFKECFKDVGSDPAATAGTAPELWRFTGGGGTAGPTTWPITKCFYNANVTNYNSIPNHWK